MSLSQALSDCAIKIDKIMETLLPKPEGIEAPLAEAISAEAKNMQKDKKQSLSSLKYGKTAKVVSLKSGSYDVKWKLKGSPLQVAHLQQEFSADSLYTLFVSPQEGKYADSLQVIVGASH